MRVYGFMVWEFGTMPHQSQKLKISAYQPGAERAAQLQSKHPRTGMNPQLPAAVPQTLTTKEPYNLTPRSPY